MIQQTPEQRKSTAHRIPEPVITKVIFNILPDKAQAAPIFRADGHTVVVSTGRLQGHGELDVGFVTGETSRCRGLREKLRSVGGFEEGELEGDSARKKKSRHRSAISATVILRRAEREQHWPFPTCVRHSPVPGTPGLERRKPKLRWEFLKEIWSGAATFLARIVEAVARDFSGGDAARHFRGRESALPHAQPRDRQPRPCPLSRKNRIRATVMMVVWVAVGVLRPDADAPRQRCTGGMT